MLCHLLTSNRLPGHLDWHKLLRLLKQEVLPSPCPLISTSSACVSTRWTTLKNHKLSITWLFFSWICSPIQTRAGSSTRRAERREMVPSVLALDWTLQKRDERLLQPAAYLTSTFSIQPYTIRFRLSCAQNFLSTPREEPAYGSYQYHWQLGPWQQQPNHLTAAHTGVWTKPDSRVSSH